MTTEELIVHLARSAAPVRPLRTPARRLCQWATPSVAMTALGVVLIGHRIDLAAATRDIQFLVLAIVTLATSFVAAGAALRLSVPGAGLPADSWTPIAAAGIWAFVLTASLLFRGSPVESLFALSQLHLACVIQIAALAVLPGWALLAMLRRAAPLRCGRIGGIATLAVAALAAVGTQLICPIDDPAHLLVGHFAPVAAVTCLGAAVGQRALAIWDSRT